MSLRDGTKKMSKSDPSDYSRINLTDDADQIALKFRRAKTDPEPLPSEVDGLKQRPEADNLVGLYAALADITKADVLAEHGGAQFSAFKPALADLAVAKLAPIAGEMRRLLADPGHIDTDPHRRRRTRRRHRREDDDRRQGRGRFRPAPGVSGLRACRPQTGMALRDPDRRARYRSARQGFLFVNSPVCGSMIRWL